MATDGGSDSQRNWWMDSTLGSICFYLVISVACGAVISVLGPTVGVPVVLLIAVGAVGVGIWRSRRNHRMSAP